ncbi:hypothetical protein THAOC_31650 [Thalassiosira oceanica]|uniref:Uncharacterized protein n=1 Tax=Thalassiosira oceanica TaxID=159749 RepID=K0RS10_THAOC|nr:hypothetical protein THAOC_31650 [Thalassiosira oceanica]|eukprot:EJK49472.1 hypothetical protein THAOC_31650 [Thalassiosira oceanica]
MQCHRRLLYYFFFLPPFFFLEFLARPTPSRCSPRCPPTQQALWPRLAFKHLDGYNTTLDARLLSAPTSPRSAGEFAVIWYRAPMTPVLQITPFQSEMRRTEPNQTQPPPPEASDAAPGPSIAPPPGDRMEDPRS